MKKIKNILILLSLLSITNISLSQNNNTEDIDIRQTPEYQQAFSQCEKNFNPRKEEFEDCMAQYGFSFKKFKSGKLTKKHTINLRRAYQNCKQNYEPKTPEFHSCMNSFGFAPPYRLKLD